MNVLSAVLLGVGILLAQGGKRADLWKLTPAAALAGVVHPLWAAALAAGLVLVSRAKPIRRKQTGPARSDWVEFWQGVGLYLTAGLSFWQAVEGAGRGVPAVYAGVSELARAIEAQGAPESSLMRFIKRHPGPETEVVAAMMWHGYHHGVRVEDVLRQGREMEEQLAFEEDLRRANDPIWLTVLPAVLLLNFLWIFGEPLLAALLHGWNG